MERVKQQIKNIFIKKMILIVDHNDSFVNNIIELFNGFNKKTIVINYKNNNIINLIILLFKPIICLGPGPGDPREYKSSIKLISNFYNKITFIGICLGHQIIGYYFGFKIKISNYISHGNIVKITIKNFYKKINIPKIINVVRYNSLTLKNYKIKNIFKIEAYEKKSKEIMIMRSIIYKIFTFQYHPDSFMSNYSKKIIKFFLKND
ncbi:aminodeoxychorismate/anthranilate synthase component II [Candidatus Vidania fulgoroideorum]